MKYSINIRYALCEKCPNFSGPYFSVFGLNTVIYFVNIRILSEYGENMNQKKICILKLFMQWWSWLMENFLFFSAIQRFVYDVFKHSMYLFSRLLNTPLQSRFPISAAMQLIKTLWVLECLLWKRSRSGYSGKFLRNCS